MFAASSLKTMREAGNCPREKVEGKNDSDCLSLGMILEVSRTRMVRLALLAASKKMAIKRTKSLVGASSLILV